MNYLNYIKTYQKPNGPLNQVPTMVQDTSLPLVDKQQYEIYDSNPNIRRATEEEREQMSAYNPNASHLYGMEVPAWVEAGYGFIPILGTTNQVYRATQTGDPKDWAQAAVSAVGDIPGAQIAKVANAAGKVAKTASTASKIAKGVNVGADTIQAVSTGLNIDNAYKALK